MEIEDEEIGRIKWSGIEKGLWTSKRDACVGPYQSPVVHVFVWLTCISLTTIWYNILLLLTRLQQADTYSIQSKIKTVNKCDSDHVLTLLI